MEIAAGENGSDGRAVIFAGPAAIFRSRARAAALSGQCADHDLVIEVLVGVGERGRREGMSAVIKIEEVKLRE